MSQSECMKGKIAFLLFSAKIFSNNILQTNLFDREDILLSLAVEDLLAISVSPFQSSKKF